jgi:uncharacterized protein
MPSSQLTEVVLSIDELETIRLADFEGMYQEQAAVSMNISRQTFGRIIESAHKKIADVLINGKALKIEGGEVSATGTKSLLCPKCRRAFNVREEAQNKTTCSHCKMPT